MKNLKNLIEPLFESLKAEYLLGRQTIKVSLSGNHEPIELEIVEEIEEMGFDCGFVMDGVSVIYDDDGFSRILIHCYDADRIMDHIKSLETKADNTAVSYLCSALNKAITMLDGYNNMYGDEMPKTQEISELDEILKAYK